MAILAPTRERELVTLLNLENRICHPEALKGSHWDGWKMVGRRHCSALPSIPDSGEGPLNPVGPATWSKLPGEEMAPREWKERASDGVL